MVRFKTISEIKEHPQADALDIAIIDGWQICVKKRRVCSIGEDCSYSSRRYDSVGYS